jgi:CBS domain-containing protein
MNLSEFKIASSATLLQAVEKIEKNKSRAVVVMSGEKAIGVLSEGDIMRALLRGIDIHTPVSEVTRATFRFLPERDMKRARELFAKHLFGLIPILDSDFRVTDVITLSDLFKEF